ncbi:MAG: HAD-IIB family hydrolase [Desulfobacterales bacterium]
MNNNILLCSDMDRTILPNGVQDESPKVRSVLRLLVERPEIQLAYVSGRDKRLIQKAIAEYDLPFPDYAVGDVGTTIYELTGSNWNPWEAWFEEIAKDWNGLDSEDLSGYLMEFKDLTRQEPEKQNRYKLSYYANENVDSRGLVDQIQQQLSGQGLRCRIIWSVDEQRGLGLVDVLPQRASKLHAIRYLMDQKGYLKSRVVFCGDSGNDLNVLTSDIQAVLVRNASDEVRREALESVVKNGRAETLYVAKGNFMGMNGNYTAGVLEGLAHFEPRVRPWIEAAVSHLGIL